MDTEVCPVCKHALTLTEISTNGDSYFICVRCKLVYVDENSNPGLFVAAFRGETTLKDTKDYYEVEIIFLTAMVDQLGTAIHANLSQWACHHNASLSLLLRLYLAEARERLHRLETKGRERP